MRKVIVLVLFGSFLFALPATDIYSQPVAYSEQSIEVQIEHDRCLERLGNDACWGFAARDRVSEYREPNRSSKFATYNHPAGWPVGLLEPKESEKYPGWVSVIGRSQHQRFRSWMRHDDLVLASDLRRVIDCWPIQAINWDEQDVGDYPGGNYRLKFDKAGKILPQVVDGHFTDFYTQHLAIYYARGIFLIAPHTDLNINRFTPVFLLDGASKKLTIHSPAEKPSVRFFSEKKLEGCKNIPTVDSNASMKFR